MSFFGKKYKKVKSENVKELMEALNINDHVKALLSRPDNITSFSKNDDGSIQYVIEANGVKGIDEKIVLNVEADFTAPDGGASKNIFTLDNNVLKSTMTRSDGKKIYYVRTFEGNTLKMEMSADGIDITGTVYYEEV